MSKVFGNRLIELRKRRDLTQQQLADLLHMSRGTYAHYEIGKREPDFNTLKMFADYFHVTTDYMLGRTKHPNELLPDNYSDSLTKEELEFAKKEGIVFVVVPEKVAQGLTPEKVRGFIQDIKNLKE